MSLSKYYTNSKAFQPEELIRREDKSSAGWQSLHQGEQPFLSQRPPVAAAEPDKPPVDAAWAKQQAAPVQNEPEAAPARQEIDVTNYLERAVAEKRIEEAYQKGLRLGTQKCEEDFGAATRALLTTCQQLDAVRETIIGNSREELQALVLAIAERIVRISVREQDTTIVATIEEALQRAVKSDEFTVYLHPEDYDTVAGKSADLIAGLSGLNKIVLKKDGSVQRGGAKVESDNCTVDATIASQFDVIREEMKKNL